MQGSSVSEETERVHAYLSGPVPRMLLLFRIIAFYHTVMR